eukprot:1334407-Rhodomonas_salina.1
MDTDQAALALHIAKKQKVLAVLQKGAPTQGSGGGRGGFQTGGLGGGATQCGGGGYSGGGRGSGRGGRSGGGGGKPFP